MEEPLLAAAADNCPKDQGASPVVVFVEGETLSSSSSSLLRWEVVMGEIKKVVYIAMPMMVTTVSQYLLRVISMMMIGHLGELSLSGAAIATSLTNVTGFSILLGMASALETLCGQAYGAKQYQLIGTYTFGAIISLLLVCIPISILWIFTEDLLVLIGQDPLISHEAGIYSIWLIPTLFPCAILQLLIRYLLAQSLLYPMLLSSVAALLFHIPMCWMLIFKFEFGSPGAALSIGLSYWLNVIILGIYVKYSSTCENTRISFSKDVYPSIREFFRYGIPSAVNVMICLQWWSSELAILLSGLLSNPQLETSVLTICFIVASLHYYMPYSFSTGASTRVSNESGAGHAEEARLAAWVATFLAVIEVVEEIFWKCGMLVSVITK
ncbi:Protein DETOXIFICATION [Heracleum sosnowskyi]|uniref:Protein DETOXIFICATION n=1 Tax=Heracleum sosnowskyi TaxID=360622 RepID=A0AAD8HC43_9APIA|nr:Protein DETOXIFICATION [Heracleum sosnowskyi]